MLGAVFALVAAGAVIAAIGAGALDIAIGQEAAVGVGVDLFLGHFLDQACLIQFPGEVLGQCMVLGRRGTPVFVKGQAEPIGEVLLNLPHLGAVLIDGLSGLGCSQFGGRAVFVGGAQEQNLIAARTVVAGIKVRWKLASNEIAEVLDPVDVGDGTGDENAGHWASLVVWVRVL